MTYMMRTKEKDEEFSFFKRNKNEEISYKSTINHCIRKINIIEKINKIEYNQLDDNCN